MIEQHSVEILVDVVRMVSDLVVVVVGKDYKDGAFVPLIELAQLVQGAAAVDA